MIHTRAELKKVRGRMRTDLREMKKPLMFPIGLLIFARLLTVLSLPIDGLRGYGDFSHFFNLSSLSGWPFLNYWVEFPPVFPFLSTLIVHLSGGQEHVFDYLLIFFLLLADCGSLLLFFRILPTIAIENQQKREMIYLVLLASFAYCWWYFDSLAIFFMLLAVDLVLRKKDGFAGLVIGLGALTKLFPLLTLVLVWKNRPIRRAAWVSACALIVMALPYTVLYGVSPAYTTASITAQVNKGSWETVWALVDGNLRTGNFGPIVDRLDPGKAQTSLGNGARVPPLIPYLLFGCVGFWILVRSRQNDRQNMISLLGLAWCLFLLASPGWSPQWVLYLIPLILLSLPWDRALLFTGIMVGVNLLEWPVLLSRGLFWGLFLTIPLRTIILALLAIVWASQLLPGVSTQRDETEGLSHRYLGADPGKR